MVFINEWLPNPIGNDNCKTNCGWNLEFVELFNRSSSTVDLNGWTLWTGGKSKKVFLSGAIGPHWYAVFKKAQSKFSLKNNDGGLWLYGPGGGLADAAAFTGAAPVGKSFSRLDYGPEDTQHFVFADPTPAAANQPIDNAITARHYPQGIPLDPPLGALPFLGLLIGFIAVLAAAAAYLLHENKDFSQFIFGGDASVR